METPRNISASGKVSTFSAAL